MNYLVKLNRLTAWLLLILIIIYFLTGFDILKNLWRPEFSRWLHTKILPLPTLILVFFHALVGLKQFLLRNKLTNKFLSSILIIILILTFFLLLYLFWR